MTFNAPQAAKGKLPTPGEPGVAPLCRPHQPDTCAKQQGIGMAALPCNQAVQGKLPTHGEPGALQKGGAIPCVLRQREPANTGRVSSQAAVAKH